MTDQGVRVSELRLVLTVADYDAILVRLRDALRLVEVADYSTADGRAVLLDAGRATIELGDEGHAEEVDRLEVGRRVAGQVRLAFEVGDVRGVTASLAGAGSTVIAEPTATPWESVNARLDIGEGIQVTVYGAVAG
jgi:lactoylglutathione lyase